MTPHPPAPAALKDDQSSGGEEEKSGDELLGRGKKAGNSSGGAELDVEALANQEDGDDDDEALVARNKEAMLASGREGSEFDINDDNRVCTYRDFSHIKAPESLPSVIKRNPPNKEATFPMKLHAIVSSPDFWECTWLEHGRSWRINNPKSFEERVIPMFFRHGRYTSFARQVNGWGFRRITHGSDFNSYYHELFLRGMPHLCDRMRRLTNKDSGARKKAEAEKTPDLAAITKEHPLPDDIPLLPTAAVASAAAAAAPHAPRGMDTYLSRLSENGGVDAYLSSLSDAEIAFLARRQMFRPEMMGAASNPLLGGDPARMAAMNPHMFGAVGGMGFLPMGVSNPGMSAIGGAAVAAADPRASMAAAAAAGHAAYATNPAAKASPGGKPSAESAADGQSPVPNAAAGALVPEAAGAAAANPNAPRGPPGQGNPAVDQLLNRASDNELAQLIAMRDAAAARRRQQF